MQQIGKPAGRQKKYTFLPYVWVKKRGFRIGLALWGLLAGWACSPVKNLDKGQFLLRSQRIKGNAHTTSEYLTPFLKPELNRHFLGLPILHRVLIYNQGLKSFQPDSIQAALVRKMTYFEDKLADTTLTPSARKKVFQQQEKAIGKLRKLEKGNWLMRNGERPALLDTQQTNQVVRQMQLFLQLKRGFFQANVQSRIAYDTIAKMADVTYFITENKPYFFNDIAFDSTGNSHLDSMVLHNAGRSLLRKGSYYSTEPMDAERDRLSKMLRNDGYFLFNRQFVTFLIDTSVVDSTEKTGKVNVKVNISDPSDTETHQRYHIKDVYFISESNTATKRRDTLHYHDINYVVLPNAGSRKRYSKSVLNSKVTIRPGNYYSLDKSEETQLRLGGMDVFKFANIIYDTSGNDLKASIFTSPLERYQTSEEVGGTVSQGLPGPVISWTFKVRNVFRGLGIFETTARASIEGQTGYVSNDQAYASEELSINPSVTFPKMFIPTRLRYKFDPYNPRTRLLLGFSSSNRPEYARSNLRAAMVYSWRTSPQRSFSISLVDINFVRTTRIQDEFQKFLDSQQNVNQFLINSFNTGFVSSVNAAYTYNDFSPTLNAVARYLRVSVETGGAFLNLLTPVLDNKDKILGVQFYRYYRFNLDFRHYRPVSRASQLVFRINTGLANTYANTQALPYEKFFFGGGSNSIRAWGSRRLGLGSAPPPQPTALDSLAGRLTPDDVRYRYEQQGNILLELNAEYRFKVFKYLNMALFSDAGNLWRIKPLGADRPNADFSLERFYKELAWGGGIGVRLDFSFLIIRADLATKFYEPYRTGTDGDTRWRFGNISWGSLNPFGSFQKTQQQTLLNLGIGYPF